MRNILLLFRNMLRVTFRKKSSYVVYLLMPMFVVLLSLAVTSVDHSALVIGVSNKDQDALGAEVVSTLKNEKDISLVDIGDQEIKPLIKNKKIDCAIVIPQDFTLSLKNGSPDPIEIVEAGAAQAQNLQPILLGATVDIGVQNFRDLAAAANGNDAAFDRLCADYFTHQIAVRTLQAGDESRNKHVTANGVGFFIMFLMYITAIVSTLIINEKVARTFYRIICAPLSSWQFLLGNLLTNLVIVLVQIAVLILSVVCLFRIDLFLPVWQLFVVLFCFGLASISVGFLIAAFSKDSLQSNTLQNLIIVPSSLLAGCFFPTDIMPDVMKKASYFMPQRWALEAIRALQQNKGFASVWMDLAVIVAFALAFFLVAMYRFSRSQEARAS